MFLHAAAGTHIVTGICTPASPLASGQSDYQLRAVPKDWRREQQPKAFEASTLVYRSTFAGHLRYQFPQARCSYHDGGNKQGSEDDQHEDCHIPPWKLRQKPIYKPDQQDVADIDCKAEQS